MKYVAILLFSLAAFAQDSLPTADGAYYRTAQGIERLELLTMAGGGATHVGKMFVPGLTPHIAWTFRGSQSPIQISEHRPTFLIKQSPMFENIAGRSVRDLLIVRMDRKKDRRELQATNGGNIFTFKSGLDKGKTPEISAIRVAEGVYEVSPNNDLPAGEYMLTFSALGFSGYDFGIK